MKEHATPNTVGTRAANQCNCNSKGDRDGLVSVVATTNRSTCAQKTCRRRRRCASRASTEELVGAGRREKKLVVWFTNTEKGLVLNRPTIARSGTPTAIPSPAGSTSSSSCSRRRRISAGRLVPALRVRIPPPKQASGNGQTCKAEERRGRARDFRPSCSGAEAGRLTTWTTRFRFEMIS